MLKLTTRVVTLLNLHVPEEPPHAVEPVLVGVDLSEEPQPAQQDAFLTLR